MLRTRTALVHHWARMLVASSLVLAGCAGTGTPVTHKDSARLTQVVYSDDGVSELSTPGGWVAKPNFGPDAAIRVAEENGSAYLVVNSYFPGEINPTTVEEFSRAYADSLKNSLTNARASDGNELIINGARAHRHVVTGQTSGVDLTYITTVVQGQQAMHHLIGWVAADDFRDGRNVVDDVIATFRESANTRPAKERIALNFAWPDSFQSTVNLRRTKVKRGKQTELNATYISTVRPGDFHERVISTRVMNQNLTGNSGTGSEYMSALLQRLNSQIPDYVINDEGEFMRVDNLAEFKQQVENAISSDLPAGAEQYKDKILAMIKPNTSEQFLAAAVTDNWNKTVGSWISSSYVPGQTYSFKEEYFAPKLGNRPFPMSVSRRVAGFTPCTSTQAQCVTLMVTSIVSGEAFRLAMQRFLEKTIGKPVRVKQVSVIRRMELVTEPDTLIPHRSLAFEETVVVIEDRNGKTHTSRDTEETSITYNYKSHTASR